MFRKSQVSAACLADFGHELVCVDTDQRKIDALERGEIPIYEPGLSELVRTDLAAGRLSFTTQLKDAVPVAEVVFIAGGTPSRRGDGHADLSYVYAVARDVADVVSGFTVVVTKSTVPVGTGDEVARIIGTINPATDVAVASKPEFLRERAAIDDFKRPDRIVVGIEDERARAVMTEVYRPLYLSKSPLMFTNHRTAELIKYAANTVLAMKITFINEMADIIQVLLYKGARVVAFDRHGMDAARGLIDNIDYVGNAYAVADDADALVLVTEWNEFRSLDLERIKAAMKSPVLVDLRNVYNHDEVAKHGFAYFSVGRPVRSVGEHDLTEAAE